MAEKTRQESSSYAPEKRERKKREKKDHDKNNIKTGRWTDEEKAKLYEGVLKYGRNPSAVTEFLGTRSYGMVVAHLHYFRTTYDAKTATSLQK